MTNIHYLNSYAAGPVIERQITDEHVDKLYDFVPRNVFFWTLRFAKLKFNRRLSQGAETWFDRLKVYVGLPDWVLTEEQIEDENLACIKLPFGLINDIQEISDYELIVTVPFQRHHSETGEAYNSLHHVSAKYFALSSYNMDTAILNRKEPFANDEDRYEELIENELENVWLKKQRLIQILIDEQFNNERVETLYTCLNTCMGLAEGNKELIEEFTNIHDAGDIGCEEAHRIYSNLTIEEFFDWSTEHFGLDDYYKDTETLIDNVKFHMEEDQRMLVVNEPYKFITKMIARSFKLAEHN